MTHKMSKAATMLVACVVCLGGPMKARAAEPISVLPKDKVSNPRQPQVAVSEDGAIYVAFGAGDAVYCSTSTNGGNSNGEHRPRVR